MVKPVDPQPKGNVRYDGRDEDGIHYWEEIRDGRFTERYEAFEDQDVEGKIVRHQDGVWVWATDVNIIHRREMEFRDYMNSHSDWKTPSVINCLRYAASEANEARQAWMDQTMGDPRNNKEKAEERKKEGSIQRELAETIFMLMAALGKDTHYDTDCDINEFDAGEHLDRICHNIEEVITTHKKNALIYSFEWRNLARNVICMIMDYPGVDLEEQQVIWHEKIKSKNLKGVILLEM